MEILVHILQAVFIAGFIGCAITIPVCAIKFFAVVFEHHTEAADDEDAERAT